MGCCSSVSAASKEARDVDTDQDGLISRDELAQFIAKNEKLYMMLSVNLNLPIERCQEIATEVAYQMSKRSTPNMSLRELSMATKARNPTVSEFQSFLEFLDQATGQQEFFHRTVFATFDVDGSGYIEPHELDNFLDVFYQAGSIFAGDVRLPKKSTLKKEVMKQLDTNGDGKLEFSELRTLISGGARAGLSFNENDTDDDSDEGDDKKVTVDDNKFGFDDKNVSVVDNPFGLDDKNVSIIDDKNDDGDDNQFDAHFDNKLNFNEIAKKVDDNHAAANQERSVTLPPRPPDARRPKSSNRRSRPSSSRSSSSPKPRSHSQSGSKSRSKSRSHSRSSSDGRSRSRSSSHGSGRPRSQSNSHSHSTSPTKASSRSSTHTHSKSPSHSASRSSSRHTHSKSPSHSSHRRSSDNDNQDRRRRTKRTDKPPRRVDNDSADSNT